MRTYTYHLVGLDRRVTVTAPNEHAATQTICNNLTDYEREQIEWYDCESVVDENGAPAKGETGNMLYLMLATPIWSIYKMFKKGGNK